MKKIRFLLIALLAFLSVGFLSSCDRNKETENGEDVLNGSFIEDNIEEKDDEEEKENTLVTTNYQTPQFRLDNIVNRNYASMGLLIVKNDTNHIGFYSLYHNKYIVAPMYEADWVTYSVTKAEGVNFVLSIKYEGITTVYDGLGNVLVSYSEEGGSTVTHNVVYETYQYDAKHSSLYCSVTVTNSLKNNSTKIYRYTPIGKLVEVYDLQSDILANKPTEETENEELEFPLGSQYNGYYDLEPYGLELYLARAYGFFTLYNADHVKLFTKYIPQEVEELAIITNKLYYQVKSQLPEDVEEYSYSIGNNKYSIKTYSINLETGEEKTEDVNYLIMSSSPVNKEESELYYSLLTLQHINEDKTLGFIDSYLVDSNGVFHDTVTNLNLYSFIKLGDNYFNKVTKILYNSNLEEISYLDAIRPVIYEEEGYIVGYGEEGYGILDSNAYVLAEFVYDEIITPFSNGYVLAKKDGTYYRINLTNGSTQELGMAPDKINDNLYVFKRDGSIYFEGIESTHLTKTASYDETLTYAYYSSNLTAFNAKSFLFEVKRTPLSEDEEVSYEYINFAVNPLPNQISLTTVGKEITTLTPMGGNKDDAISLTKGEENEFHVVSKYNNSAVYTFTSSKKAYYTVEFESPLSLTVKDKYGNSITTSNSNSYSYTMLLEEDMTYYFTITKSNSLDNYTYYLFDFHTTAPYSSNTPLFYTEKLNSFAVNRMDRYYISYTAEYSAVYEVVVSDDVHVSMNSNDLTNTKVELAQGQTYLFAVYGDAYADTVTSFELVIKPENQDATKNATLWTASEISTNEEEMTLIENTSNPTGPYYYTYKNETNKIQVVELVTTSSYGYNFNLKTYNENYELLSNMTGSTTNPTKVLVMPGETVYLELSSFVYSSYYYTSNVSAYISVPTETLEAQELAQYDYYVDNLTGSKLLKLKGLSNAEDYILKYNLTNTTSGRTVNMIVFDSFGRIITTRTAAYSEYDVYTGEINSDLALDHYVYLYTTSTEPVAVSFEYTTTKAYSTDKYGFTNSDGILTSEFSDYVNDYPTYTITANTDIVVEFEYMTNSNYYNRFYVKRYNQNSSSSTQLLNHYGMDACYSYTYKVSLTKGQTLELVFEQETSNEEYYVSIRNINIYKAE